MKLPNSGDSRKREKKFHLAPDQPSLLHLNLPPYKGSVQHIRLFVIELLRIVSVVILLTCSAMSESFVPQECFPESPLFTV